MNIIINGKFINSLSKLNRSYKRRVELFKKIHHKHQQIEEETWIIHPKLIKDNLYLLIEANHYKLNIVLLGDQHPYISKQLHRVGIEKSNILVDGVDLL